MSFFSMCNRCSLIIILILASYSVALAFNDPVTGRWISRDPIEYTDGMNLYEYMASSAMHWQDPSGKKIKSKDLDDDAFGKFKKILPSCCTWTSNYCTGDLQADCSRCDFNNSPEMTEIWNRLRDILGSNEEYVISKFGDGLRYSMKKLGQWVEEEGGDLKGLFGDPYGATLPPQNIARDGPHSTDDKWRIYYQDTGDTDTTSTLVHELLGHGWPPGKGNFDRDHKEAYRIENAWRKYNKLKPVKNAHDERVKQAEEKKRREKEHKERQEERRRQQEERRRQKEAERRR